MFQPPTRPTTRLITCLSAIPLLALLAGCVAPEEPVARRVPRPAAAQTALPTNLEPAPIADRKRKAPEGPAILQVDGLGKPKSGPLPPL